MYYPRSSSDYRNYTKYISKSCGYIVGPKGYEISACGILNDFYDESLSPRGAYETKMGKGFIGFIKTVYFWDFAKTINTLSYIPRRNLPIKDMCTPFLN